MLAFSSIINFSNFVFIPKIVGLNSLDEFYEANLYPSALNLLLSPVLPIIAKNGAKFVKEFFILLIIYFLLFCLNDIMTGIGNTLWVLFGFFNLTLFFNSKELDFILYTFLNSLIFMGLILFFKNYIISFVLTGFISLVLIFVTNYNVLIQSFTNKSFLSVSKFTPFLRPLFSVSSFWLIFLIYIENFQRSDLVLFNYYQKIGVSIPVALFSYFSIDSLKIMKLEFKKYINLTIILCFSVMICCYFVNLLFDEIYLDYVNAILFSLFSVIPIVSFNLVADNFVFRFIWIFLILIFSTVIFTTDFSHVLSLISFLICITALSIITYRKYIFCNEKQ
jgi:hypothetical protein